MNRRQFSQYAGLAGLLPLFPFSTASYSFATPPVARKIKPRRLKPGDTIGIISPGSIVPEEALENGVKNMEALGLVVKLSKNISAKRGYNAGTDEQRLADLHAMFADPQVDGIWCSRGGYGCTRLLPRIDYKLIRKNPKVLIGYSDITALINAIYQKTGLITFHGPAAVSELSDYNKYQFENTLFNPTAPFTIQVPELPEESDQNQEAQTFKSGKARGRLAGGNLTLMAAMAGTPFEINTKKALLFLEDIGEKPYRIDRMLTQLRQNQDLSQVTGIALGTFNDCEPDADDLSLSLEEALKDRLSYLNKPMAYNLPFGHIINNCTLPIGIEAELDADKKTLTLLEASVQ